jgi:hypothetical protein
MRAPLWGDHRRAIAALRDPLVPHRLTLIAAAGITLAGCTAPLSTTQLAGGPQPVRLRMRPAVLHNGFETIVAVESPGSDSIALESANGIDRYWTSGSLLKAPLSGGFGDSVPQIQPAVRWHGRLLDRQVKPARIVACRAGRCREFYHEFPVQLLEHNRRRVVLAAGWSTVFARRAITGERESVLFKEALNHTVWTVQADMASRKWSAQFRGFVGSDEQGGHLDLSRVLKHGGEGLGYGIAFHAGVSRTGWLPERSSPLLTDRTVYQFSAGPSIMIKGITASSQLGLYTDGSETLQVVSTRVAVNGNLTPVRSPVTLAAEKTFSFGSGAVVSRRRDAVERLTAAFALFDDFALNLGLTNHRSAWPNAQPASDLRASEMQITLGGQYSVSW